MQVDGIIRMIPTSFSPQLVGAAASFIPVTAGANDSYDQPVIFSSIQTTDTNASAFTYTVSPTTFVVNACTPVTVQVSHLGVPVTNMRPYLGAAMHLYGVSTMGVDHVHGTSVNMSTGMMEDACSMNSMVPMSSSEEPAQFGPLVYAAVTFKEVGIRPLMGTGAFGQSLLYFRTFVNVTGQMSSLPPTPLAHPSKATSGLTIFKSLAVGGIFLVCSFI